MLIIKIGRRSKSEEEEIVIDVWLRFYCEIILGLRELKGVRFIF